MITYTIKRKQKQFAGFLGSMLGKTNFQNASRMSAINKAREAAGKSQMFTGGQIFGQRALGVTKAVGTTTLAAGTLAGGLALGAKGVVNKASEQNT